MVFSGIEFLFLFLPIFLLVYFSFIPVANGVLLAASLLFYMAGEGWFVLVMLGSIAGNFCFGRLIGRSQDGLRNIWLALGICANLAVLGYYKYIGFLITSVLNLPEPYISFSQGVHLPLGISFFTFQAISYLVDVYRRETPAETSLVRLGTYIAMFPQLVAGPIVRFSSVAESLKARKVGPRDLYYGLAFFALGLGAKVFLADGLAVYADGVFGTAPGDLRGDAALLGVLSYSLQIYFDFMGYSSMAVGLGCVLGFRFPQNFNQPYAAMSVTEFWRRWHISLSTWFRDYVYIPLGGNRGPVWRTSLNLWLVFLITGLWHGAAWNFVVWGMFHGLFLTLERMGGTGLLAALPAPLRRVYLLGVVSLGWVLFRADTLEAAGGYFRALLRTDGEITPWTYLTNEGILTLAFAVLFCLPATSRWMGRLIALPSHDRWNRAQSRAKMGLGIVVFVALIALCAAKILSGSYSPFIYFRF